MSWIRNTARPVRTGNRSDPSGASASDVTDFATDFPDFADFDVTVDDDIFLRNSPTRKADPHGVQVSSPSMIVVHLDKGDTPSLSATEDSTLEGDHSDRAIDRPLESEELLYRQVREAVERNSLAWNMGDLVTYLDGFSEDVRYVNASMLQERGTMSIISRMSLGLLFRGLFELSRRNTAAAQSVETTIVDIKLMGRDHAYVYGTYQHGKNEGVFSLTMVKENSQWLIQTKHASVKPVRAQPAVEGTPRQFGLRSPVSLLSSGSSGNANRRCSTTQRSGAVH